MKIRLNRLMSMTLALLLLCGAALAEESDWTIVDEVEDAVILLDDGEMVPDPDFTPEPAVPVNPAREAFINDIIDLGHRLYNKAGGRPQRAQYSGDIYVCKNFTVHLFRQNRDKYRMAEYPDVKLVIPNNMPAKKCKPYYYGLMWEDIPAEKGNPFYAAAEFRYDSALSYDENLALAMDFMRQVQRGDYFQMSAKYYYGVGAHSAIMISDYDPVTDTVHWMDSNMRGTKKNGDRYGYVQFDEVKEIQWWAEAFCVKGRGATIYRLRDDIVFVEDAR